MWGTIFFTFFDLWVFPLAPNSFFLLLKLWRCCVLLFPIHFYFRHLSIKYRNEKGNIFLGYIQFLAFVHRVLFISVLFYSNHSRISSLVTFSDHSIFCILLQHHFSKFSKFILNKWKVYTVSFTKFKTKKINHCLPNINRHWP